MKPSDIVVGKLYTHAWLAGVTYLGIGVIKDYSATQYVSQEFSDKKLVVISAPDNVNVGGVVLSPRKAARGFWDYFRMVE